MKMFGRRSSLPSGRQIGLRSEPVTDLRIGKKVFGRSGVVAELFPQLPDKSVVADREAFRLAERRGYVREVDGKDAVIRLIKRVVAVEGDRVDVSAKVSVNGRELVNSRVREVDSGGRPLPHGAIGGLVRPGEVWVMSDFSDRSFDSRYFGAVPTAFIEGRLRPVLTW